MTLLGLVFIFAIASVFAIDSASRFSKCYRILQKDRWYYVQYRVWWWPFWDTYSHYESYDKPKEVTRYGGFWGDIGYPATDYGYSSKLASNLSEAETWMTTLKKRHKERAESFKKKKKPVRRVHGR